MRGIEAVGLCRTRWCLEDLLVTSCVFWRRSRTTSQTSPVDSGKHTTVSPTQHEVPKSLHLLVMHHKVVWTRRRQNLCHSTHK